MPKFSIDFDPNTAGKAQGREHVYAHVNAPHWKPALAKSSTMFDLHKVRFINHPGNPGVAAVYNEDDQIIGQVTAKKVQR